MKIKHLKQNLVHFSAFVTPVPFTHAEQLWLHP